MWLSSKYIIKTKYESNLAVNPDWHMHPPPSLFEFNSFLVTLKQPGKDKGAIHTKQYGK